ncbi:cysteine desulfurase-like protein [Kordiimonas sp. SCSIO 12610]|uniref:cysteine desulfurase-like protein n=1 Tax=Kordiimonas sp. SCSIO 12610 TaxID=2829597 RepID=UPI00210E5A68|nr:cysteine desulfurase-like protein [Kordiimonas sp. SCSIO 12610]UTW55906.1 cysteine desulfurase-like protein [Kordiimonas sp. SCSIO 12610]
MKYDINKVRAEFPALKRTWNDIPIAFLDNPAGTQVPNRVLKLMNAALVDYNANLGGFFKTSQDAEALVIDAHKIAAEFVNAYDFREIFFGQNMTTLTFMMTRSLAHTLKAGDEIVLTRMDHEGNVAPWLLLAEEKNLTIKWIDLNPDTYELDLSNLDTVITEKTKIVAVNYASNITGSITDVKQVVTAAKAVGAITYIDAVQYAPHGIIDVQDIGCDMLVCSSYKFYGPHQGIMWARKSLLEKLKAYKVRVSSDELPEKFVTGTESREALAGIIGALEHFEWVGSAFGGDLQAALSGRNELQSDIQAGVRKMTQHDMTLADQLISGVKSIKGTKIIGIDDKNSFSRRVSTVSFIHDKHHPDDVAKYMAKRGISIWSGHNYALEPIKRLGLLDKGGVIRVGPTHYNTAGEIDRFLNAFEDYVKND